MILTTLLFDIAPVASPASLVGIILGVAFFFICLAVAVVAYKMLKKTVKMAVRMTIVAGILIVALIGSLAFFIFGGGGGKKPVRNYPTPTPEINDPKPRQK